MGVAILAKSRRSFECGPFTLASAFNGSLYSPPAASLLVGVGQPANAASLTKQAQPCFVPWMAFCPTDRPDVSCACGVVHPFNSGSDKVEPLPDMRAAEPRSAQIRRPEGKSQCFQVSRYSIEPYAPVLARNLLSKDACRTALVDEPEPVRPKVPLVSNPFSCACRAERLAWAGSGPDGAVVAPSCASKGVGPYADSSEEMALNKSGEVVRSYVTNIPFIDDAGGNVASGDKVAQPLGGNGVDLVVKGERSVMLDLLQRRAREIERRTIVAGVFKRGRDH
nr:hypothetical protein [Croceicoccus sp. YJ47]